MLEFKEVIYLYRLEAFPRGLEEINTSEGYVYVDYNRGYYWSFIAFPGVLNVPWYFLKEDSTLYLMREEPNFYA